MEERIILAGSGGQGVQTLGFLLAKVGMSDKKRVTWLPSYGAEKRGGFSFCHVVISDEEIYSPYVENPDTLILFDQRALNTYEKFVMKNTLVLENSSLIREDSIQNGKKVSIPATDIANNPIPRSIIVVPTGTAPKIAKTTDTTPIARATTVNTSSTLPILIFLLATKYILRLFGQYYTIETPVKVNF